MEYWVIKNGEPEVLAIDIDTARKLAEHSPRVRAILESLGVTEQ